MSISHRPAILVPARVTLVALAALSCPGCGSAPVSQEAAVRQQLEATLDRVDASVPDKARATEVKAVISQILAALVDFAAEQKSIQTRGAKLNQDYDATREQFDAVIQEARANRQKHEERFIELTMKARRSTNAAEWAALFQPPPAAPHATTPKAPTKPTKPEAPEAPEH